MNLTSTTVSPITPSVNNERLTPSVNNERFSVKKDAFGKTKYSTTVLGKTNGHMPGLVLAPYHIYGPLLLGLGMLIAFIMSMFVG